MQTFLPFEDFTHCSWALDHKRLGSQRKEAKQIVQNDFPYHPATIMWQPHLDWLCQYGIAMCREWKRRGFKDNLEGFFLNCVMISPRPWFLGVEEFHSAHRARLLEKDPEWYGQWDWPESPSIWNWWPDPATPGSFRRT